MGWWVLLGLSWAVLLASTELIFMFVVSCWSAVDWWSMVVSCGKPGFVHKETGRVP